MAKTPSKNNKSVRDLATNPDVVASTLLMVGAPLWKFISVISNIDFLLSINDQKFALAFTFLESTGWWLVAVFGALWLISNIVRYQAAKRTNIPNWNLVGAVGFMAFMFGILITAQATGSVPPIVSSWGGPSGTCIAVFDTSRAWTFKERYKIALACGVEDATTDKLEDTHITFSKPFTITGGAQTIVAAYSAPMTAYVKNMADEMQKKMAPITGQATGSLPGSPPIQIQAQFQIWHDPVLVPNNVSIEKVATLAELLRLGGKILRPQYFR